MVAHSAATVENKHDFELLWHRHGPRGHLFMPAGYEPFAFRPGGQAGSIWNYFHEMPQDSPAIPTPANAPRDTDLLGLTFRTSETNNAHLVEGELSRDENNPNHSITYPLTSTPSNEEDEMEGWEPYGSDNSGVSSAGTTQGEEIGTKNIKDDEDDRGETQDAEAEVKSKSREVTEAETEDQSGWGGLDRYEPRAI
ncbi:unnamed protein product [Tuber aestivum]|uniref:Uncharacterized protein n=1 Tax=Tuber aestivum TaxID=59557 RepID=A0A292PIP0_9PEZI|nr:unnamed protein product [Tuber aestivum]